MDGTDDSSVGLGSPPKLVEWRRQPVDTGTAEDGAPRESSPPRTQRHRLDRAIVPERKAPRAGGAPSEHMPPALSCMRPTPRPLRSRRSCRRAIRRGLDGVIEKRAAPRQRGCSPFARSRRFGEDDPPWIVRVARSKAPAIRARRAIRSRTAVGCPTASPAYSTGLPRVPRRPSAAAGPLPTTGTEAGHKGPDTPPVTLQSAAGDPARIR